MSTQFDVRHSSNKKRLLRCQPVSDSMEWTGPLVNLTPSDCRASAPTLSDLSRDDQGNTQVTTVCYCNSFLNIVPEEFQKGIANYLSSGDLRCLTITPHTYHIYLKFAEEFRHAELKSILDKVKRNCDARECRSIITSPMFEVIFNPMADNQNHQVQVFDIRRNVIHTIDVKKVTRFGDGFATCVVYVEDCPYILISGGYGKTQTTIEKYDVVENKWIKCCALKNERKKHRMNFVNGSVFIIGGKKCKSVERYDIANNNCMDIASLPVPVHSFAATAYGDNVYIFGGKTETGDVACVQCLNTRTETVSRLSDLPYKCSGGQAIAIKGNIYFATNHGHMIKFDPKSGESELCSRQPYKRKHFAMFSNNDCLCIFGGLRTEEPIEKEPSYNSPNTMYAYTPDSDTWTLERCYNKTVRVYTSCTVRYPKECPVKPFMKLFGYC